MTEESFEDEMDGIKQIANVNGYTKHHINELVIAHKRKKELRNHTTLALEREGEMTSWAGFNYNSEILPKIKPILNQFSIKMRECSKGKLKNIIGGSKDKVPAHNQSRIYSVKCNCCDKIYIGQTRRDLVKRFNEHDYHMRCNAPEKSSIAEHMLENGHNFDLSLLIKRVDEFYKFNAFEAFYIDKSKNNKLTNENNGPIKNSIFPKYYT